MKGFVGGIDLGVYLEKNCADVNDSVFIWLQGEPGIFFKNKVLNPFFLQTGCRSKTGSTGNNNKHVRRCHTFYF
jgi:hypothetical protein